MVPLPHAYSPLLWWLEVEDEPDWWGPHVSEWREREAAAGGEALPRWLTAWHATSAKRQKVRSVTVCDGKCVGARVKMANEGVSSVRMAKS